MLIALCANQLHAQLKGDTYAAAKQKKTGNWTFTYAESPGFASKDASGNVQGICVDLMKKFAEYVKQNEGITVNVQFKAGNPDDFTYFLNEVKAAKGGVFGLSNTTITEARKKSYNFSPPYITNIGMILTNKSVTTLNNLSDIAGTFSGKTAITVKSSTNEKSLLDIKAKYMPGLKLEYVSSFGKVLDRVVSDPNTFANLDFTYYLDALKNNRSVKRHPGGDTITEKFGIIMPLSNDWSPILDKFMTSGYVGGVEYRKTLATHLGQNALKFLDNIK